MSLQRRFGLVATVLSLAVSLTGCGSLAVSFPFRARPVISPQQARVTFLRLETERTVGLRDENKAALARVETGQALANDLGEVDGERATGSLDDVQGFPFTAVSMLVPRLTSYPAWFAAETRESGHRALIVVARPGPKKPWRLQFETLPGQPIPHIRETAGYATVAALRRNLSSDLARYYNNGLLQKPTHFVLPGPYTSKEVSSLRKQISSLQSSGWSLESLYRAGRFIPAEGLVLQGGGTLGFATLVWTISVSQADGSCFWQDAKSSYWAYLGSSGSTSQLTYTRLMSAPVIESRAGERVVGLNAEETQVDRQDC